jgi:hypothetical protein
MTPIPLFEEDRLNYEQTTDTDISGIPSDVIAAYKKFVQVDTGMTASYREPSQKGKSTFYFNRFLKACKANSLDYNEILPKLGLHKW